MQPANGVRIHISGIDLIRDEDGRFRVLEDNLRNPSGVSYVLQNRRTLAHVIPEVFADTSSVPSRSTPSAWNGPGQGGVREQSGDRRPYSRSPQFRSLRACVPRPQYGCELVEVVTSTAGTIACGCARPSVLDRSMSSTAHRRRLPRSPAIAPDSVLACRACSTPPCGQCHDRQRGGKRGCRRQGIYLTCPNSSATTSVPSRSCPTSTPTTSGMTSSVRTCSIASTDVVKPSDASGATACSWAERDG